jgi:hypothetical protein
MFIPLLFSRNRTEKLYHDTYLSRAVTLMTKTVIVEGTVYRYKILASKWDLVFVVIMLPECIVCINV